MPEKTDVLNRVRAALSSALTMEPGFTPEHIECDDEGVLILKGEVQSVKAKKLALEAVAALPDVSGIVDRLRVAPASAMGDAEISAHLRNAFVGEPSFEALVIAERVGDTVTSIKGVPVDPLGRVEIEVDSGVVILNGQVPGLDSKRLAGVLAWWVPGTRDVINGLVEPLGDDTPGMLQEAVRIVLDKDPFVNAGQIRVGAKGRVVRLTGLVASDAERSMAERDAWYVFGIDDVINEIEVGA